MQRGSFGVRGEDKKSIRDHAQHHFLGIGVQAALLFVSTGTRTMRIIARYPDERAIRPRGIPMGGSTSAGGAKVTALTVVAPFHIFATAPR